MKAMLESWQFWALLSAGFAALTAIFAKVGVENVGSDFATFIRTIVILVVVAGTHLHVPRSLGDRDRSLMALLLPCAQTRRSLPRRPHRQDERRPGRAVRRLIPRRKIDRARLDGRRIDRRGRGSRGYRQLRLHTVAERMVTSSPSMLNVMLIPAARATSPA